MKCFNSNLIHTNSRHTLLSHLIYFINLEEPNPFTYYIAHSMLYLLVNILFLMHSLLLGEIHETCLNQMGITPYLAGPI